MSKKALNTSWVVCQCILLLVIIGLICGCDESDDKRKSVQGWVSANDKPVSDAYLTFYNLSGEQIYGEDEPSVDETGYFLIFVYDLPADFRVVARDGKYEGQSLTDDLSADFRNFNHKTDIIYINAVTTMISAYIEKHPEVTLDQATIIVKKFLEIPDWVNINSNLSDAKVFFDHGRFIEAAANNGGINRYIEQLIAEIDGHDDYVTHPFRAGTVFGADENPLRSARVGDWIEMKCISTLDILEWQSIDQIVRQEVVKRNETDLTIKTVIKVGEDELLSTEEETPLAALDNLDELLEQEVAAGKVKRLGSGYEAIILAGKEFRTYRETYKIERETADGKDTPVITCWSSPELPVFGIAKISYEVTGTSRITSTAEVVKFSYGTRR